MKNCHWLSLLSILVGNTLYALSVLLFLLPANLMSSGTTGIALVMNQLFQVPLSEFIFVFNIAMLALGWWILGKQFAMTTVVSSVYYPLMLELLSKVMVDVQVTDNIMLNVLFAGMGIGLSLGIVIRAGASTGGMDIPPLILNKQFRIPVSISLWTFDFVILMAQIAFHPLEDLLYGILLILTISFTLNKVMLLGSSKTEIKIISSQADKIRDAILSKVDRGVTILHGEGGYLRHQTEVILSIVSNHELPKIEYLARNIDPESFIIVSRVTEVWGRGFTAGKKYHPATSETAEESHNP